MDKAALDELPDISPIADLDNVPSFDELTAAFASTRENKAPGSCCIPAEVWKHSGKRLQEKLHELIVNIWRKEQMPQNWKDPSLYPSSKRAAEKNAAITEAYSYCQLLGKFWHVSSSIVFRKRCVLSSYLRPNVDSEGSVVPLTLTGQG